MSAIIVDMSQYESVKYSQQLGNKANNYMQELSSSYAQHLQVDGV